MLEAYLYAQTNILPQIRKRYEDTDRQQLLTWFHQLHGRLSKTLLKNYGRPEDAGRYTEISIIRWHKGAFIGDHLGNYFSNAHFCKTDKQLVAHLVKEFSVKQEEILAFIKLVRKINQNKAISIHESIVPFIDNTGPLFLGVAALSKLHHAYYIEGALTTEEKNIVEKIAKPCIFPHRIPAAMDSFADETIARFAACNPKDMDEVSEFLAEMFYRFTDIHPYANGNG